MKNIIKKVVIVPLKWIPALMCENDEINDPEVNSYLNTICPQGYFLKDVVHIKDMAYCAEIEFIYQKM